MALPTPPSPPIIDRAAGLVSTILGDSASMATESMTRGLAAIESLGQFALDMPAIVAPDITIPTIDLPAAGIAPADPGALVATLPALPADPLQGDIGALDVGDAPAYNLVAPLLVDVPLPDPLEAIAPLVPVLPDVADPVEPDFSLPAVPTFTALNIPNAPTFDVPTFTDDAPTAPLPIEAEFAWSEVDYASDNLAALNNRLLSLVTGNDPTALPAEVEAMIWQKGVDAEVMMTYQAADDALQQIAARGFTIPGGQLIRVIQQAINAGLAKDVELSRATMIEQAQLEQQNFHFAFSSAMQLEGQLIGLFNNVQARALDAAKFRVQAAVDLFNARVNLYQADVTAFGAKAEVFKARLQAALGTLEVYKAQLLAAKITGELNVQLAEQYTAQVSGVQALADVYRARVEAVSLAVETNKNRTLLYRSQIEAAAQEARANAQTVQTYLTQIQAQQARAEMFSTEVAGYTSRVEAYRTLTDAKLSEATLQFRQLQEFPVELYRGRIAGYQAQISGEAARLSATADVFASRVEAYAAVERVTARQATAQADVAATTTKLYASQAQIALQAGVTNMKMSQIRAETAQASLRAAGQLSTQLASAAMAARNVSAAMSGSTSNSSSVSVANSESQSASNGKSFTASTSTNSSSTTGVSHSSTASFTNSQSNSMNQTVSDTTNNSVTNSTTMSVNNDTQLSARNIINRSKSQRTEFNRQTIYMHRDK